MEKRARISGSIAVKKYSSMFHSRKHGQKELAVDLQDLERIRAWLTKLNIRCLVEKHEEAGVANLLFGSRVTAEALKAALEQYEELNP
jgi:hypothetical protein